MIKIYRHLYDKDTDDKGIKKPNELLGDFDVLEGDSAGYEFEFVGIRKEDGKRYRVFGVEVSYLTDRYNAGTKCFIENPELLDMRPETQKDEINESDPQPLTDKEGVEK